jgi:hypothetical protein
MRLHDASDRRPSRALGVALAAAGLLGVLLGPAPAIAAGPPAPRSTHVQQADSAVDLAGMWLFHPGDNPAFAQPGLDDLAWEQRYVPAAALAWPFRWQGYAWYRLHLALDEAAVGADWLISLGPAREVAEVYVNGSLVGARGRFGSRPQGGERIVPLTGLIPAPLLQAGDNVVAVRLYDPSWSGGLAAGPLLLGPPELVRERTEAQAALSVSLHLMLAALAFAFGLAHLAVNRGRRAGREPWWLAGAGLGLALLHLGGTSVLSRLAPTIDLAVRLPIVAAPASILCLGSYFAARYEEHRRWPTTAAQAVLACLCAGLLLSPDAVVFFAAGPATLTAAILVVFYATHLLAHAARRQEKGALPLFAALVIQALLFAFDGLNGARLDSLPPLSLVGGVGLLIVVSLVGLRQTVLDHEAAEGRMHQLEQLLGQRRRAVLDVVSAAGTRYADFLEAIVRDAAEELQVRRCSLALADGSNLKVAAAVGLPRHAIGVEIPKSGSIAGWVFCERRPLTNDSVPPELAGRQRNGQYVTAAFVSYPVLYEGSCLGVLNFSDRFDGGGFAGTPEQRALTVAGKVASALLRVQADPGAAEQRA